MNELKIFENKEFGQVRVIEKDGEPWFVAKDIADVLYFSSTWAMTKVLDDDEKDATLSSTLGGNQEMTIISEYGLYSVILKSRKQEARNFRRWITHEVIPSIRKTGTYISENLSPQLQLLINMELKQKQLETEVQETKQEVQAIRENILFNPQAEWRKGCNKILNAIGKQLNDYKKPKDEAYNALKVRANCRPNVLISNLQNRATVNGMAKSKVAQMNFLDVLENEPRLREIYVSIVKEMAIKYGTGGNNEKA